MIGERFADWTIDAELSRDHKGQAYRGHFTVDPSKQVLVRILAPSSRVSDFHDLFRGRVSVMRKLTHPNIAACLAGGIVHSEPYVVFELPEGKDYQVILKEGQRPSWQTVLGHALQIVAALRHSHRRGVLHGELKPANIIRTPDGQVKLIECGLSRLFEAPPFTSDNLLGSAAFISPEQASGKQTTKRGDFYSVGCLLYALLTGRPPFMAANAVEMIHKHCFVMPERPTHYASDLPEELDALIMRLLSKDPQVRPGSGTLLLSEFERIWGTFETRGKISKRPILPPDDAPLPADEEPIEEKLPRKALVQLPVAPPKPLMRRPWVVLLLFASVVGLFWIGLRLSRTDPDALFEKAKPLMASTDPADWEKAQTEYLDVIQREFPQMYVDEIAAFRARTTPVAELRKAVTAGKTARYSSEAERLYHEGMALARTGDFAAARRMWDRVAIAFDHGEDARWARASKAAAVATPTTDGGRRYDSIAKAIEAALLRVETLKSEDRTTEAIAVLDALLELYEDEPEAAEPRRRVQQARDQLKVPPKK